MMMLNANLKHQQGLSLIEFMVAGVIGLILTLGLFQIFTSNRQAFETTAASSNVQETGRIATEIMARAVRNADYWGCVDRASLFNNLDDSHSEYDASVLGFEEGVSGEDNNADGTDSVLDGTDTLTLRGARGSQGIQIDSPMPNSSAILNVNAVTGLEEGDIITLSNCQGGDIFQITKLPAGEKIQHHTGGGTLIPGNGKNKGSCAGGGGGSNCLSQLYDSGSSVMLPYSESFYIGTGTSGEPALFLRPDIELVAGVEDMQILYGEDEAPFDGAVDAYRTAAAVADMENVISIRISFLVRSSDAGVLDSAQTLTFNGAAVDGSDRRLRRVYTMTSTIRNRM